METTTTNSSTCTLDDQSSSSSSSLAEAIVDAICSASPVSSLWSLPPQQEVEPTDHPSIPEEDHPRGKDENGNANGVDFSQNNDHDHDQQPPAPTNLSPSAPSPFIPPPPPPPPQHSPPPPLYTSRPPICPAWTRVTQRMRSAVTHTVTTCAVISARRPKPIIAAWTLSALTLLAIGLCTNFTLMLDIDVVFAPLPSQPAHHHQWITSSDASGFDDYRNVLLVLHNHGDNVLHVPQMERLWDVMDVIRTTPGLDALCHPNNNDHHPTNHCRIWSASGYWHHNKTVFQQAVQGNDTAMRQQMSSTTNNHNTNTDTLMTNQPPIMLLHHDVILGNHVASNATPHILQSAQSYVVSLDLPNSQQQQALVDQVETELLHRLAHLRTTWIQHDNHDTIQQQQQQQQRLTLDVFSIHAIQMEALRGIFNDLYLMGVAGVVMVAFTCLVFYHHHDRDQSRCRWGIASVLTIGVSMMMGYGILFVCGVPFTSVTQVLPFMILGIGLDDTFIITGAYLRTTPHHGTVVDRVNDTMLEVGWSISVTTLTTDVAFLLGWLTSSLPGVQWLCLYAMVLVSVDFMAQNTFFIACLVLDEHYRERQQQPYKEETNITKGAPLPLEHDEESNNENQCREQQLNELEPVIEVTAVMTDPTADLEPDKDRNTSKSALHDTAPDRLPDRIMKSYAAVLMKPVVKGLVLVVFAALTAMCAYRATLLEEHFDALELTPHDSFIRHSFTSLEQYASVTRRLGVYFRNVDQTSKPVQQQMIQYVEELEALPQLRVDENATMWNADNPADGIRSFCWVRDLERISELQPDLAALLENRTLLEQLDLAMIDPTIREVYGRDIVRDAETGNITASRCWLFLRNLDMTSVQQQKQMLFDQRAVAAAQPINQDRKEWAFFAFDEAFFFWEAYSVAVNELIATMISGVVAVTAISFLCVPHWSAAIIVCPLITMLYVNLLGLLQLFGLYINGLTYVCVVVSIGLLIDFILHILLKYNELLVAHPQQTRDQRVRETLQTMGACTLLGGLTTLLGVLPATISTAKIFTDICLSFVAIVILGLSHGLVLLPVVLSLVGAVGTTTSVPPCSSSEGVECASKDNLTVAPSRSLDNRTTLHHDNEPKVLEEEDSS